MSHSACWRKFAVIPGVQCTVVHFFFHFKDLKKASNKPHVGEESPLTMSIVLAEPTSPSKNAAITFRFENDVNN